MSPRGLGKRSVSRAEGREREESGVRRQDKVGRVNKDAGILRKHKERQCEREVMKRRAGKGEPKVTGCCELRKLASFRLGLQELCSQTVFRFGRVCTDKAA